MSANVRIEMMKQTTDTRPTSSPWISIYKVGGVAALIAAGLFLSDVIVLTAGGSMPGSAHAWFALFQNNKAAALLQLFFTDLIGVTLLVPVIFALYTALRRRNRAYSALAAALAFIGIALVLATNSNYSLIYLSDQYMAATTEVQRSHLLAAAESTLATGMWGTGPLMAGFLLEGAIVMISVIMLKDNLFGKGIAYLGIVAHGFDLSHAIVFLICIPLFDTDTALALGTPLLAIGGTLQLIWYPLIARKLFELGRLGSQALPQPA